MGGYIGPTHAIDIINELVPIAFANGAAIRLINAIGWLNRRIKTTFEDLSR